MERRQFLGWVGVGALASSLPVVIAACGADSEVTSTEGEVAGGVAEAPPEPTANAEGYQEVGTVEQLESEGQLFDEANNILVVDNADSDGLIAVNPTCPHQGCAVAWESGDQTFVCPCHNSVFAVDGEALTGPANAPLETYEVKVEENAVLVQVS